MKRIIYVLLLCFTLDSCNNQTNDLKSKELNLKEKELELRERELNSKDSTQRSKVNVIPQLETPQVVKPKALDNEDIDINSLPFIGTITLCDKSMTLTVTITEDGFINCKRDDTEEEGWVYYLKGKWNKNGIIKDKSMTLIIQGKDSMKWTDNVNHLKWWFNPCRN